MRFSDWRGKEADYSTNAIVTDWYQYPKRSIYYRQGKSEEFFERLYRGDTLKLGLDYYAFFAITAELPPEMMEGIGPRLKSGEVVVFQCYALKDSSIAMDEIG